MGSEARDAAEDVLMHRTAPPQRILKTHTRTKQWRVLLGSGESERVQSHGEHHDVTVKSQSTTQGAVAIT